MIEYVIYCRRSSDESSEKQVQSIPDQIEKCMEYKEKEGLTIKKKPKDFGDFQTTLERSKETNEKDIVSRRIYNDTDELYIIKESHSAKKPNKRPKRKKLIKLVEQGKIQGILSYSPDRQARNMIDGGTIIELADEGLIDLKYCNFHFNNDASGRMMLGFWFVFSKQYSDKLSEDINRGNKTTVKKGKSRGEYMYGYIRDEDTGFIKPQDKYFPLMRKAFDLKIYEGKSDKYIADRLNANGYIREYQNGRKTPVNHKQLGAVRKKEVYYGVYINGEHTTDLRADGINPLYKPMITEEEYYMLNPIEKSIKDIRTKQGKKKNDIIRPYTQGLVNTIDGYAITPTLPNRNKRYGAKITELRQNSELDKITMIVQPHQIRCECKVKDSDHYGLTVNYDLIEETILGLLSSIEISKEDYNEYKQFMSSTLSKQMKENQEKNASLQMQINRIKGVKLSYIDRHTDALAKMDKEETEVYYTRRKEYDTQIDILRDEMKDTDQSERDTLKEFEAFVKILTDSADYFKNATYVQKRKISDLFFLNIIVTPEKTVAIEVREGLQDIFTKNPKIWR